MSIKCSLWMTTALGPRRVPKIQPSLQRVSADIQGASELTFILNLTDCFHRGN
jgi:hypothetical protein